MMLVITFNSNSWKAAEEYLAVLGGSRREATMLMFQEHKLLQGQAAEQGTRLAAARWASLWEPALQTKKGGAQVGSALSLMRTWTSAATRARLWAGQLSLRRATAVLSLLGVSDSACCEPRTWVSWLYTACTVSPPRAGAQGQIMSPCSP